jgi:energy-converting hydrogenase A subunit M
MKPPSAILKQKFSQLGHIQITDSFVEQAAKDVLLNTQETKIWLQHLSTVVENRKREAAATRQLKRKAQQQAQQKVAYS